MSVLGSDTSLDGGSSTAVDDPWIDEPGVDEPGVDDPGPRSDPGPPDTAPPDTASPTASALAIALAVPERLAEVEDHVRRLEEALLYLAGAIGKQRMALTADVDDIVAHQSMGIRRTLQEVLDRLPPLPDPEPPAPPSRRELRAQRRAQRHEEKSDRKQARRTARAVRRARRRQLVIPSLFLIAGVAGGTAVALAPYTAEGQHCEGPLAPLVAEATGSPSVAAPSAACERSASDRLLLATIPALGGVMATVAVVVMGDSSRGRPDDATPRRPSGSSA